MPLLPPVIVELRAQVDEFTAKMGAASDKLDVMSKKGESFGSKFGAIGSAAFMAVGAAAVGLGVEALHLADAFETSHARLTASLQANGTSFDQWKSQIQAADNAGQKLGFTNAEVEDGLARLETMVKNPAVALKDLAVAEDIARARGIDLTTASQAVGKASEGTYTALVRLGVVTKEQAKNFQSGADAVDFLGKAFAGQASTYADTFAGKLQVLKATSEDVGKNIGLVLIPILETVASALATGIHWIQDHTAQIKQWGQIIGAVVVPVLGLWAVAQAHVAAEAFISFLASGVERIQAFGAAATATAAELYTMAAAEVAAGGPLSILAAGVAGVVASLSVSKGLWNDTSDAQKTWLTNVEQMIPKTESQSQGLKNLSDTLQSQMTDLETNGLAAKGAAQAHDDLGKKLHLVDEAYKKAMETEGAAAGASKDAKAAFGGQAGAVGDVTAALNDDEIATDDAKVATEKATEAAKAQDEAIKKLTDSIRDHYGLVEDATKAELNFQQKLADGTQVLKTNKDQLGLNTQAGRDDMSAVLDQIDSVKNLAKSLASQGQTIEQVNPIIQSHIDKLHDTWHAAGLTQGQIADLDKQYGLTPHAIDTQVFADLHIDTSQAINAFEQLAAISGSLANRANIGIPGFVPGAASGTITKGLTLAGEGNPAYPEYVIPTDPMHRDNAVALTKHLVSHLPGLAGGGIVNARPGLFASEDRTADIDATAASLTRARAAGGAVVSAMVGAANASIKAFQAQAAVGSGLGGPGYGSLTSWLGVPYLWGGGHNVSAAVARRTGVDCSGLVDQVYGQTGNTGTQFNIGTAVAGLGASLPGDLVFFGTQAAGEPHHVGIITNAGGSEMIDAPHTGTVVRYDRPSAFGSIQGIRRWPNGPVGQGTTGGAVDGWLEQAMAARGVGQDWLRGLEIIARYESNNSPSAVNRTDINAQMGTPSEGLMQVIQPTFDSYKMAGHNNIFNPVDNAIASIGYILARYGNINNVPGVRAVESGHPYVGYDSGGILPPGRTMVWNGTGRPERVVSPDGAGGGGVNVTVNVQGSLIGGSPDAIARALLEPIRKAYDVRGRSLVGGAYR